jgi:hypothetical protein
MIRSRIHHCTLAPLLLLLRPTAAKSKVIVHERWCKTRIRSSQCDDSATDRPF